MFQLQRDVLNSKRPDFRSQIPDSYKELIENCWSQNPDDRPTFDQIVEVLRSNSGFITELVNKDDYYDYIDYIDDYKASFDSLSTNISIDDFMKKRAKAFTKVTITEKIDTKKDEEENEEKIKIIESLSQLEPSKIMTPSLYPKDEFVKLSPECKKIVMDAEKDIDKQFLVGKSHIEGVNGFTQNTEIGIFYLKKSAKNGEKQKKPSQF